MVFVCGEWVFEGLQELTSVDCWWDISQAVKVSMRCAISSGVEDGFCVGFERCGGDDQN